MLRLLRKLWDDDRGALLATEWVFMGTILVIGVLPGVDGPCRKALAIQVGCHANPSVWGMSGR